MTNRNSIIILICIFFIGIVRAQDIEIELMMPATQFGPGSLFSLHLSVLNEGPALSDAQLFVALSIGTGDFWFYPNWVHYPPDIGFESVDVPADIEDLWEILPEFEWPSGAGTFEGASFFSAILHDGELKSDLADVTFGWQEEPVNTATPTPSGPTSTPTQTHSPTGIPSSTPALPTSTPDVPTPTMPPTPTGFVNISSGTYTQGSPDSEACRDPYEGPQRQVTITRGLYVMEIEVTRRMWADLKSVQPTLPDDPSNITTSPTMNHPVQMVWWNDAILFANLMSVQYGMVRCYYKNAEFTVPVNATNYTSGSFFCNFDANGFRLPTEAEWEYVCRAGTTGAFSCDEPEYDEANCYTCTTGLLPGLEEHCIFCANDPGATSVAGSKNQNPWGLHDIHGNVFEWCWDWHDWSYPAGSVTDPAGPSSGSYRIARGGAFNFYANSCRSGYRNYYFPDTRSNYLGFRLLRSAVDASN